MPSVDIKLKNDNIAVNIVDLIILSKIEKSKSEIRRLIKGKGIKINNEIVADDKFLIQKKLFGKDDFFKLSIGKKKHLKINLT